MGAATWQDGHVAGEDASPDAAVTVDKSSVPRRCGDEGDANAVDMSAIAPTADRMGTRCCWTQWTMTEDCGRRRGERWSVQMIELRSAKCRARA